MNNHQAILVRKSIRSFEKTPVSKQKMAVIENIIGEINFKSNLNIDLIDNASSAFNSFKKSYGLFKNVKSIVVIKGLKNDENLDEKAGYYGEKIILELVKQKLGTCWVGGTYNKDSEIFNIANDEKIVALIVFGYAMPNSSMIEKIAKTILTRKSKQNKKFYKANIDIPEWFELAIDAVAKAPSALNRQQINFEYKDDEVIAYTNSNADSIMVDMGIAKFHFEVVADGCFELGNNAKFNKRCVEDTK